MTPFPLSMRTTPLRWKKSALVIMTPSRLRYYMLFAATNKLHYAAMPHSSVTSLLFTVYVIIAPMQSIALYQQQQVLGGLAQRVPADDSCDPDPSGDCHSVNVCGCVYHATCADTTEAPHTLFCCQHVLSSMVNPSCCLQPHLDNTNDGYCC